MFGKFWLKSKTIWGVVLMALPTLFSALGLEWQQSDGATIEKFVGYGVEVVGFILAVWGRKNATKPLVATPTAEDKPKSNVSSRFNN